MVENKFSVKITETSVNLIVPSFENTPIGKTFFQFALENNKIVGPLCPNISDNYRF